jgi:Ca2+-binding EF-hand superfamily protein
MRFIFNVGICAALAAVGCQNEVATPTQETPVKADEPVEEKTSVAASKVDAANARPDPKLLAPGLGVCEPSERVEVWGTKLIEHADANRDRRVSKKEAESFVNFLLGGFFFRADENGDGKVTQAEGKLAREEFARDNPIVAKLLAAAKSVKHSTGKQPFVKLADILDVAHDGAVSAKDVREAAREALSDLYRLVDADDNGELSLEETRQAGLAGARSMGHQTFAAADGNSDGAVDLAELTAALEAGAKTAFHAADADGDGRLTETEAARALGALSQHVVSPTAPPSE